MMRLGAWIRTAAKAAAAAACAACAVAVTAAVATVAATLVAGAALAAPSATSPTSTPPVPSAPRLAPAPLQLPDTLAQRVEACTACHGKEGRATNQGYFPRIAGKPAGYLYHQLVNFREGRRQNDTMARLVEWMTDDYLQEIAGYFASLDLPYPPPAPSPSTTAADTARGEVLVHRGDKLRGVPACAACHGTALTGVAPAIPGLLGLPKDYLAAQVGAWRTGQRKSVAPDCMAVVASRLSVDDVGAVAAWLAAQPVPGHALPALAGSQPSRLPLDCGSVGP